MFKQRSLSQSRRDVSRHPNSAMCEWPELTWRGLRKKKGFAEVSWRRMEEWTKESKGGGWRIMGDRLGVLPGTTNAHVTCSGRRDRTEGWGGGEQTVRQDGGYGSRGGIPLGRTRRPSLSLGARNEAADALRSKRGSIVQPGPSVGHLISLSFCSPPGTGVCSRVIRWGRRFPKMAQSRPAHSSCLLQHQLALFPEFAQHN